MKRRRPGNNGRRYTDAEVEQAKDYYCNRGMTSLSYLSRLTGVSTPTLWRWRKEQKWDDQIEPCHPADLNFLHHMTRTVLTSAVLKAHDAIKAKEFEQFREWVYSVGQLARSLESLSKSVEEWDPINLEVSVQKLVDACESNDTLDDKQKEMFLAVIALLQQEINGY